MGSRSDGLSFGMFCKDRPLLNPFTFQHDELGGGDPSKYIFDRYTFQNCFVRKSHEKEDLDKICAGDWDYYLNFLVRTTSSLCNGEFSLTYIAQWAGPQDDVAGISAVAYLESKKLPIIGHSSAMLAKHYDKASFYADAERDRVLVPSDTPGRYPKIVKYSNTTGSLGLTPSSVCVSQEQVDEQIKLLLAQNSNARIFVQDYIAGIECSAIVLEMGHSPVALNPLEYVFPKGTPPEHAFLTFENKFENVDKGIIQYAFTTNIKRKKAVQKAAVDAFRSAGMSPGGAWARVDMRIETTTDQVYVLEVNPFPCIFCQIRNTFGDDLVIQETFPGSHFAIMDILIASHRIQHGVPAKQYPTIARIYDKIAAYYDETSRTEPLELKIAENVKSFDWTGSVLDLGCGTGYLGELLHLAGSRSKVVGVDLSPGMTAAASVKKFYRQPVTIEPIQDFIFKGSEGSYDHVASYSTLHFFDNPTCTAVIARMFMLARRSVSFEIDDLSPQYLEEFSKDGDGGWSNWNNMCIGSGFPTPKGWKKVQDEHRYLYRSVHLHSEVHGRFFRYEKEC
ncbi:MAG: hypothetical protein LQ351_007806 [Letrouitia transgressa]|nr:MAG: hypothetical protein LQ351_007806 [Letrouitia transgressa]